ncbi:MAG: YdeI/OmpD-associated family protein, partial [Chloroflexota bacterium]|nr:YdeI/OmpD-associated family protein [Chloroflexota bacterium]
MSVEHRFTAELEAARAGGAVVLVPREVATALGGLKQMRVVGSVNGVPHHSSTMPYGGRGLFMGVHKATREAAGVGFGERVEIVISRDDRPRVLEIPPELESAFSAEPALRDRFEALAYSRRRDLAAPISEARRPETRAARLAKAVAALR